MWETSITRGLKGAGAEKTQAAVWQGLRPDSQRDSVRKENDNEK